MRAFLRHLISQFIFLFGLVWALVGTPLLIAGLLVWRSESELARRGVQAEARLVEKAYKSGSGKSGSYLVRYSFQDQRGAQRLGEARVSRKVWKDLPEGSRLPVLYLPERPEKNRLGGDLGWDWWVLPLVLGFLGLVFAPAGFVLVFLALRRTLKAMELLRNGVILTGRVLELREDLGTTINGRHPFVLVYGFRGPDGKEHQGQTQHLPQALEGRWQVGGSVTVICDPQDPSRHEADILGVRMPV